MYWGPFSSLTGSVCSGDRLFPFAFPSPGCLTMKKDEDELEYEYDKHQPEKKNDIKDDEDNKNDVESSIILK